MMHLVAFQQFARLPENYPPSGLGPDQAKAEFDKLAADDDAITDLKGPSDGYRLRVGIAVECLAIDREALVREQGYELQDFAKL